MSLPIEYYLNLITSEYRLKPNFISWLSSSLQLLDDATSTIEEIFNAFNIDNAIGNQLDLIGQIIGQERKVGFQPTDGSSPVLDDTNYRTLLKAKIVQNHWRGQIKELVDMWSILFPEGTITIQDTQDMAFNVIITGNLSLLTRDLVLNGYIIPKPEGVNANYYFGDVPIFGYDISNEYYDGYEVGKWWSK